jgi:hypothetical protein
MLAVVGSVRAVDSFLVGLRRGAGRGRGRVVVGVELEGETKVGVDVCAKEEWPVLSLML